VYSALLGMRPPLAEAEGLGTDWNHFLYLDQLESTDLTNQFPRREPRSDLVDRARRQREQIYKACFDVDYLLLPSRERRRFRTNQHYWKNKYDIIGSAYEKACAQKRDYEKGVSPEVFVQAYLSKMTDYFVGAEVVNRCLCDDIKTKALKKRVGYDFRTYLEKYGWSFEKGFIEPAEKRDGTDLLVNVLDRNALILALSTGRLGRNGIGRACFSENRVCYDRGYALVFRLDELQQVYPMFRFDECPFDAHLLKEWRSPTAVCIDLAVALLPTDEATFGDIPEGRAFGTKVYGRDVVNRIKRNAIR